MGKINNILKLIRFHKPIGTLLLLWPTLSAFFIITEGDPSIKLIIIFSLGTFLMRSAGCVINDYFDKDIDGRVERTKDRPLVTGDISPKEALCLFYSLLGLASVLLIWTNLFTVFLAFLGALLTTFYPLTKRIFKIPQIFLGFAFSWGVIMVSAAETNSISPSSILIFTACFFWIIAYDTAYAMSDKEDDLDLKIQSSALTFGPYVKIAFLLCHCVSLFFWSLAGFIQSLTLIYYIFLFSTIFLIIYQYNLIKNYDRKNCLKAFQNNNWNGLIIFLGSVLGNL